MNLPIHQSTHVFLLMLFSTWGLHAPAQQIEAARTATANRPLGPYLYEAKPAIPELEKFNPRLAPPLPEACLARPHDRLVIIGDSITEQKMYSRMMEAYVTACVPQLEMEVRQLGWSGEKAEGFLRRIDQDCLRFQPTLATLCYGMNDSRYRPFDINNGRWYADHYGEIVRKLQAVNARVVVGSPGCAGKIASWVKSKNGTLDEHNLHLCTLRDIAIQVAADHRVGFADIFWPMFQAQTVQGKQYGTPERPYEVAGTDGIHPGWAGHTIMAYAFLRALGFQGDLATFRIDLRKNVMTLSDGHQLVDQADQTWRIQSTRYPFCAKGSVDDHNSIRSGMTLVPFNEKLNRWTLQVSGLNANQAMIHWGDFSKRFSKQELQSGVNLADVFVENPFSQAFENVDAAIAAKQAFETLQIKKVMHGKRGRDDLELAVSETEAERDQFVDAIHAAFVPVTHTIRIEPITD